MEGVNKNENRLGDEESTEYVEFLENHGIKKGSVKKYLHQLNKFQIEEAENKFPEVFNRLKEYQEKGMNKIGFGDNIYYIDDKNSIFAIVEVHDSQDPKSGYTINVIDKEGNIQKFELPYNDSWGEDNE